MILGHTSHLGTSSYGKHYELSSTQRARQSRIPASFSGTGTGTRGNPEDSDEELVRDQHLFGSRSSTLADVKGSAGGIMVNTRVDIRHKDQLDSPGLPQDPFDPQNPHRF